MESTDPGKFDHQVRERNIEDDFIDHLEALKYTYRPDIRDRKALEDNFRRKFETLNQVYLTDPEFDRLLANIVTADTFLAAKTLRENGYMERDDGTPLHYQLVNRKDWCKNDFEVVNQLRINTIYSYHQYDVVLLVNGLPLVQVELKTLDLNPRRAMEQIVRYKNDPGNGYGNTLLCCMQLFIVSNRTRTWYFANNRAEHFAFDADERYLPIYQLADADNRKIPHLHDFTDKQLHKCGLAELISRYMVLVESERKLLIMRPYQIYAVKAMMDCIEQNRGNGYIWHTTGSGKTLTSFKAATLLKQNRDIDKCLFVVDRKDLDRQTREEFNKFQLNCVEQNTNTEALVQRLLSEDWDDKVIVTTIQKLGLALDDTRKRNRQQQRDGRTTYKERLAPLRDKRMVFIFDECHRSQFGDNHQAIRDFFPKAQLFGFTGTPIFEDNASRQQFHGEEGRYRTTQDVFQQQLHAYTITHAIDDKNVLRFHVDYLKPELGTPIYATPEQVAATQPSEDARKQAVVEKILDKHASATNQRRFNAFFATGSINDAIAYYQLFKAEQAKRQKADPDAQPLNIACVFSPPAEGNKDVKQLQEDLPQEKADNQHEPEKKKAALKQILADYNDQYGTNHRIGEFDAYYQDVQQRIKDQQYPNSDYAQANKIDLTIVVDMLLTGFDSKYMNTLYVDKNLKHHGLIQAFSRTNRVLNATKPYGNILDFRGQQDAVDQAITLFSGEGEEQPQTIWLVDPAPKVIDHYQQAVKDLQDFMGEQGLDCTPEEVSNLKGDQARAEFIKKFKEVQRHKTQLDQYTDLTDEQRETIAAALPEEPLRGFKGVYLETAKDLKAKQSDQGGSADPATQANIDQLDFEFVLFSSATIDYDYIMKLVADYSQQSTKEREMTRQQLVDLICAQSNLLDERDTAIAYIDSLPDEGLDERSIRAGYERFKEERAGQRLATLAQKHELAPDALQTFVDGILERMIFDGEQLSDLLAPRELGWKARTKAELALMDDLVPFLHQQAEGRPISGLEVYE